MQQRYEVSMFINHSMNHIHHYGTTELGEPDVQSLPKVLTKFPAIWCTLFGSYFQIDGVASGWWIHTCMFKLFCYLYDNTVYISYSKLYDNMTCIQVWYIAKWISYVKVRHFELYYLSLIPKIWASSWEVWTIRITLFLYFLTLLFQTFPKWFIELIQYGCDSSFELLRVWRNFSMATICWFFLIRSPLVVEDLNNMLLTILCNCPPWR
jgi:hypothetical protein